MGAWTWFLHTRRTMDDCSACLERLSTNNLVTMSSSPVCHDCVRRIFENAIRSEHHYPPRWGSLRLRPSQFRDILSKELRDAFREKEEEYLTPPAGRVYCTGITWELQRAGDGGNQLVGSQQCGAFLGRLLSPYEAEARVARGAASKVICGKCGRTHCLVCGDRNDAQIHQCNRSTHKDEEDAAFRDLTQGKDYQVCPSTTCGRKLELQDGCNHIICVCGQNLCFVCGQPARESNHWRRSR